MDKLEQSRGRGISFEVVGESIPPTDWLEKLKALLG